MAAETFRQEKKVTGARGLSEPSGITRSSLKHGRGRLHGLRCDPM
jgi:hypothetical protein